jgi:hypothetical protein
MADDANEQEQEQPNIRPFTAFLFEHQQGALHDELSQALHDVIAASTFTGKAGAVTLTVSVTPSSKINTESVVVSGKVATKLPAPPLIEKTYYVDNDGNLSQRHPNQLSIDDVRTAPAPSAEARTVAPRNTDTRKA